MVKFVRVAAGLCGAGCVWRVARVVARLALGDYGAEVGLGRGLRVVRREARGKGLGV